MFLKSKIGFKYSLNSNIGPPVDIILAIYSESMGFMMEVDDTNGDRPVALLRKHQLLIND